MQRFLKLMSLFGLVTAMGCGLDLSSEGTPSEVATTAVSGAINGGNPLVGYNAPKIRASPVQRVLESLKPIGEAWAFTWSCQSGSFSPKFAGPGNYTFTPPSCSVAWGNGRTASSSWSGTFDLDYGASCDAVHPWIDNQAGGCVLTRTTASGGVTRTIEGPNGATYAITHDTNGAGTGWDSTVSPAPTNAGVVVSCASGGCDLGKTVVINGSHLTGTITPSGGSSEKIWDHTVSSGTTGLAVTGEGGGRVVNGSVTVQHNLAQETAQVTFNAVSYGDTACCFPTGGSLSTAITDGKAQGKSEALSFGPSCGEATLTRTDGKTVSLTLQHCL
jgi:hypothetical protein